MPVACISPISRSMSISSCVSGVGRQIAAAMSEACSTFLRKTVFSMMSRIMTTVRPVSPSLRSGGGAKLSGNPAWVFMGSGASLGDAEDKVDDKRWGQRDAEGKGHLGRAANADIGHHRNEPRHGVRAALWSASPASRRQGRCLHRGSATKGRHGGRRISRHPRRCPSPPTGRKPHGKHHAEMRETPGVFVPAHRKRAPAR